MNYKTLGVICLLAAMVILMTVAYHYSSRRQIPLVFSPRDMLVATWGDYREKFIEDGTGRTIDFQNNGATTSEGQSYTMLRAVWIDDKETFDRSWQWTQRNLKKPGSNLFSWLYGELPDGTYDIRTDINGQNSASDADSDIALALIFAYSRWQDSAYLNSARAIINDIWNNEVVVIQGKPYLAANNIEKSLQTPNIVVNPSYLSPASYKIFAVIDREHPWDKLADASYQLISSSMKSRLDKTRTAHLPPDWVLVNRSNGSISAPSNNLTTNYGYDAIRVPWRLALDVQWNQDSRAKDILANMTHLKKEWEANKKILAVYGHDGTPSVDYESVAAYGSSMGYFLIEATEDANDIYDRKLRSLYDPDTSSWKESLNYYDDNWAWFGIAMYHNFLPNLAESLVITN